jgi:ribonucleoside-diphosphate reductase alpha chain
MKPGDNNFRTSLGRDIFYSKYAHTQSETWKERAYTIVDDVCGTRGGTTHALMSREDRADLAHAIHQFQFLPGGRYIYYAGRGIAFYNNCFIFIGEEDTREEWGRIMHSASDALMSGGGIGVDYTVFRNEGSILKRTGGRASGPIPLAMSVNNHGRNVRQGGSRRSAIYGSLNHQHGDIERWLLVKDWANIKVPGAGDLTYAQAKMNNFDAEAPLDFTNISVNYDNAWLDHVLQGKAYTPAAWQRAVANNDLGPVFMKNVEMALRNGEPGFSFNFFDKERETGRNACTEVTTSDDSDVCNLGSVNMANIEDIETFKRVVELGSKFLVCGTIRGVLPDEKIRRVREKNRRLGLGLMGVHEWLLQRGHTYEMVPQLRQWMAAYRDVSESAANEHCDRFFLNRPAAYRSVAPTGTIGLIAGTTTGIEPIFAVAYKRRYIDNETRKYAYAIDQGAQELIDRLGLDPDTIESSMDLAADPERRVAFQADVQDYVDMAISSTINLPSWGSELNNEDKIESFARTLAKYAPRLRGFTSYPDGALRRGQGQRGDDLRGEQRAGLQVGGVRDLT